MTSCIFRSLKVCLRYHKDLQNIFSVLSADKLIISDLLSYIAALLHEASDTVAHRIDLFRTLENSPPIPEEHCQPGGKFAGLLDQYHKLVPSFSENVSVMNISFCFYF
jgi:hypothetical protein